MKNLASLHRPRRIKEIVGQAHIKRAISNLLIHFSKTNEFPRSLIIHGPYGTGKTTIARIIGMYGNCELGPTKACLECESCKSMLIDQNPDYWEIDAASNSSVGDIPRFQDWAALKTRRRRRFLVVDEAHRLSNAAWERLQKFLEDNIQNATFIFCTTDKDKIKDTILSRSTELKLLKISPEELFQLGKTVAEKEGITFESDDALLHLVRRSDGHARDLVKSIEQVELFSTQTGFISNDSVYTMLDIHNVDAAKAFITLMFQTKDKEVLSTFIKDQQPVAEYFVKAILEFLRHELYSRSVFKNNSEYIYVPLIDLVAVCGLLEDTLYRLDLGQSLTTLYVALERWWAGTYSFCENLAVVK